MDNSATVTVLSLNSSLKIGLAPKSQEIKSASIATTVFSSENQKAWITRLFICQQSEVEVSSTMLIYQLKIAAVYLVNVNSGECGAGSKSRTPQCKSLDAMQAN